MKTILVPVDFSNVTPLVVDTACRIALSFGSKVVLLHVADPVDETVRMGYFYTPIAMIVPRDLEKERQKLSEIEKHLTAAGVKEVEVELVSNGRPVSHILAESVSRHADLIIMGSHGHGALYNLLAGSVTAEALKFAMCPVMVVPSPLAKKQAAA